MRADGSGGSRIVPTIQAAKVLGITSKSDWFGYGIDADQKIIKPLPGFTKGQSGSFFFMDKLRCYCRCYLVDFFIEYLLHP